MNAQRSTCGTSFTRSTPSVTKPSPPYAAAVREWEKLEQFVDGRLRRE